MKTKTVRPLFLILCTCLITTTLLADPCGMVPPIYTGNQPPIRRIGLQKTYVFFKEGVETFVIRPGYSGKIDNFGMLIPFPTPPELRKVPDNVFEHIANAIDPPEVVVDLTPRPVPMMALGAGGFGGGMMEDNLAFRDRVTVVKQEAVGMYEVAVLQAGSAAALKRWMDENGYTFPKGMEDVANEYIGEKWCFVAVKTKIGNKQAVAPKPGQRGVNPKLPDGSTFDGNVQAMGFRFKSERLVVPMRLSAFNEGDTRNVLYLLTDGPRRINAIPEEYVMRQISGQQLIDNMTRPLPLRIIGGTEKDIPQYRRAQLTKERDPKPKNGVAKELFASDLLAITTGKLSLPHEEQEKELLRIGERLGLRGAQIDQLNMESLAHLRDETVTEGLQGIKTMTLTVVDGDFPREIVSRENLTFAQYTMPAEKNNPLHYDATRFAPAVAKPGILKVGAIDWEAVDRQVAQKTSEVSSAPNAILLVLGLVVLGFILIPTSRKAFWGVLLVAGLLAHAAVADQQKVANNNPDQLIEKLDHSKTAESAIESIKEFANSNPVNRDTMVHKLLVTARENASIPRRGWAIAALAEIGGQDVDEGLLNIHADGHQPMLVRTWAAAARVSMTQTVNGLLEKGQLIPQFPALGRPISMRILQEMQKQGKEINLEQIIEVGQRLPQLQSALAPAILAAGSEQLVPLMVQGSNNNIRRTAAGYVGALINQGDSDEVIQAINRQLQFDPQANEVPWHGGALFIPGVNWGEKDAQTLVGNLIRWHLWAAIHHDPQSQQQITNNLRSIRLANAAKYQSPGGAAPSAATWLLAWGKSVGADEIESILKEQNIADDEKYADLVNRLK